MPVSVDDFLERQSLFMKLTVSLFLALSLIACTATFSQKRVNERFYIPGSFLKETKALHPSSGNLNMMHTPVSSTSHSISLKALTGDYFGVASTMQRSYDQRKFGRIYFWDQQGNLKGSSLFVDISGKNKRGPVLILARHKGPIVNHASSAMYSLR